MPAIISRMGLHYYVTAADKLPVTVFLLQHVRVYATHKNGMKEHQRIMFFNFITFANYQRNK